MFWMIYFGFEKVWSLIRVLYLFFGNISFLFFFDSVNSQIDYHETIFIALKEYWTKRLHHDQQFRERLLDKPIECDCCLSQIPPCGDAESLLNKRKRTESQDDSALSCKIAKPEVDLDIHHDVAASDVDSNVIDQMQLPSLVHSVLLSCTCDCHRFSSIRDYLDTIAPVDLKIQLSRSKELMKLLTKFPSNENASIFQLQLCDVIQQIPPKYLISQTDLACLKAHFK